jgi:hypothetical protein
MGWHVVDWDGTKGVPRQGPMQQEISLAISHGMGWDGMGWDGFDLDWIFCWHQREASVYRCFSAAAVPDDYCVAVDLELVPDKGQPDTFLGLVGIGHVLHHALHSLLLEALLKPAVPCSTGPTTCHMPAVSGFLVLASGAANARERRASLQLHDLIGVHPFPGRMRTLAAMTAGIIYRGAGGIQRVLASRPGRVQKESSSAEG